MSAADHLGSVLIIVGIIGVILVLAVAWAVDSYDKWKNGKRKNGKKQKNG